MIVRAGARVDGLVTDKLIYGIRLEKHKNDKNDMMSSTQITIKHRSLNLSRGQYHFETWGSNFISVRHSTTRLVWPCEINISY